MRILHAMLRNPATKTPGGASTMIHKLLAMLFGDWDDADDMAREAMWRGIVIRPDGSAYRTNESINEMVREYLASRPSPAAEPKG
jgi:hypothetical protein